MTTSPARIRFLAVLAVACLSALGACSVEAGGVDYQPDELAGDVADAQREVSPDLEVENGTCPDEVDIEEKGDTFECTVLIEGIEAPYTVTVDAVTDDDVELLYEPAKAIVSTELAVQFLTEEAAAQGLEGAVAECGETLVVVQDPGTTFPCTLSIGADVQELEMMIDDLQGTISIAE